MTDEATETAPEAAAEAETPEPTESTDAGGQLEATDDAVEDVAAGEESTDEPGYEAPVDIDSLPEELQEHARQLEKQFKAQFSRKTAALAEERSLQGLTLYQQLEDPDTQEEAFARLAEAFGYSLPDAEAGIEEDAADEEEPAAEAETPERDPEVEQMLREREAEKQTRTREAIKSHIGRGIETYADSLGIAVDDLPTEIVEQIQLTALAMPPGKDGLPQISKAIDSYEASSSASVEMYLESKRGETPDLDGEAAVEQLDTSTEEGRLRASEKIAARHASGH